MSRVAGRVHSDNSCRMTAETLRTILLLKNRWLHWMDLARQPPTDAFDVNVDPFGENESTSSESVENQLSDVGMASCAESSNTAASRSTTASTSHNEIDHLDSFYAELVKDGEIEQLNE